MKYELIIIGGGAAGFSAAIKANDLEAESLLINNTAVGLGGTCVNEGCLPTKHLLNIADSIHRAKEFCSSVSLNFRKIVEEKDRIVAKLREEKYVHVLKGLSHVDFVEGDARVISREEVEVNGTIYRGKKFVIATGSSPLIPPIKGMRDVDFLTNKTALELKDLPSSMIILGGGALGIEFAQLFSRLGSKVVLLQRGERILKREEPELANMLHRYLEEEGIKIFTSANVKEVKQEKGNKVVIARVNGKEMIFQAEHLFLATGRKPNTGFGVEKLGVTIGGHGEIVVDKYMRAGKNVYAAGDVTGEPMLETVAAREGMIAGNNALSSKKLRMDYRVVPHAVFTSPAIAGVGITDEQAIAHGIKCTCNTIPMSLVPRAVATENTKGAIKMVVAENSKEILGVHILADNASELIHEAVMIVKNRLTIDDVTETLHVFPTLSEAIKLAAQSFRRDVTKMSCCVE